MASVTCGLTAEDQNQLPNHTFVSSMGLYVYMYGIMTNFLLLREMIDVPITLLRTLSMVVLC